MVETGGHMQLGLFGDAAASERIIKLALPDADVSYQANWLDNRQATAFAARLKTELQWQQDTIKLFGKLVKIPRLQAWYGDPDAQYQYSGLAMTPLPWHPLLSQLKQRLEQHCGCLFNSVLANWYRDGNDSMGMHSDDEPELGATPVIASLTLGQARPFAFVHKTSKVRITHTLEHGSLLVMQGETQRNYRHGINKTSRPVDDRINLTFRYVYPA